MERDYAYEGFNIHVAVQAFATTPPRRFKLPEVGFAAVVTITRSEGSVPVLPQLQLTDRDGKRFSSEADTLLAASSAGRRAIDDLLGS
jgi:hypothetical protein